LGYCQCGCNSWLTDPRSKYKLGHFWAGRKHKPDTKNKMSVTKKGVYVGSKHPLWKGGRKKQSGGYMLIWKPDHPHCDVDGYVLEHRLVMEAKLGRYLESSEHVHHINGNKLDNRPENLESMTNSEHRNLHIKKNREGKATLLV
jgi:hypothetical protein